MFTIQLLAVVDKRDLVGNTGRVNMRESASHRGVVRDNRDSTNTGDDSSVGLSSGDLTNGVGVGRPLAVVDVRGVDVGNGVDIGNSDRGTVGNDSMTSDMGDDSSVSLSSGDLTNGVGLGVPSDGHHHKAQLQPDMSQINIAFRFAVTGVTFINLVCL